MGSDTSDCGSVVGASIKPRRDSQPEPAGKDLYGLWQGGDFVTSCMALDSGDARWRRAARDAMPARGAYIASQFRALSQQKGVRAGLASVLRTRLYRMRLTVLPAPCRPCQPCLLACRLVKVLQATNFVFTNLICKCKTVRTQ